MKKLIIWLCSMIAIVLLVNTAGGFFVKLTLGNILMPAYIGYSSKVDSFIHPEYVEPTKEKKNNGLGKLAVRSVFSNGRINNKNNFFYNFLFMNVYIDETHIFFDSDGTNQLSTGIFSNVFVDNGNNLDYMRNTVGVVNINEFCKLEGTDEIYKLLKIQTVRIRLDSYTINENYIVNPVEITVLDENNTEILTKKYPSNGKTLKASDIYFYDDISDKEHSSHSLYKKMTDAYRGSSKTDKIAEKLIDKATFDSEDQSDENFYFTLGSLVMTNVEVTDNKAMITALHFNYISGVILYTAILGTILTVIMILISRANKKKNEFY